MNDNGKYFSPRVELLFLLGVCIPCSALNYWMVKALLWLVHQL